MNKVKEHFDYLAKDYDRQKRKNAYYHNKIRKFYKQIIPKNSRVLEVGCATGELLNAVNPSYGVGIDISGKMVDEAKRKFPDIDFRQGNIDSVKKEITDNFDFIILSDLLDYIDDLYLFFNSLKKWMGPYTKIIVNNVNPLWSPVINLAQKLRLRTPDTKRNLLTLRDISNILEILDFDIAAKGFRLTIPVYIPLISSILNKIIPRIYVINNFSFMQFIICRKKDKVSEKLSCSIIVPCHNEEANIEQCIKRIPEMGKFTEIIAVNDGSKDNTLNIMRKIADEDNRVRIVNIETNVGKGKAVKTGFDNAKGDVLIILDADMTVMPEDIPKFFHTIESGHAEFVNGTRMIYPMERGSMKFLNFLGNKTFGIMLSVIMEQRNTDTLCGTKAFLKRHYNHIEMKDCKWGDFDLLYGAAKLKLKMAEMPVHYKKRTGGSSKMKAFQHGISMLKTSLKMLNRLE